MKPLTKAERYALSHAAHNDRFGWHFGTSRSLRRRTVNRLVERGLVEDGGVAVAVDGDGWTIEPERWSQSWKLTDAGRAAAEELT
jgi:hypothetical protein